MAAFSTIHKANIWVTIFSIHYFQKLTLSHFTLESTLLF